jgi:flagellar biosynthesis/type III secretory pathway protein FliH
MIDDIIRETPAYKVLTKEAHEEGVQEGLERGIELGLGQARQKELQRLRHMLLNIVRARFPKLVRLAKKQGIFIEEPDILDALVVKISIAQTMEEAKYQLLTADEGEEDI